MELIVGTFNAPALYTLHFDPEEEKLAIQHISPAVGGHSWLSLSPDRKTLYCTAWTAPTPSIAAYKIQASGSGATRLELINQKPVRSRPGYVCCSTDFIYTVGGSTGEVFKVSDNGAVGELVQQLAFHEANVENISTKRGAVAHGDFGGLRHGAHSCDLSPDGKTLYVADIGRNCVWVFGVSSSGLLPEADSSTKTAEASKRGRGECIRLQHKQPAPRSIDGPRHAWPHPNGKIVYSLQEHSNMVDVFQVEKDAAGTVSQLRHCGGVSVLPPGEDRGQYWADEVRLSSGPDPQKPEYLFASTRGLLSETMGYVSVFLLHEDGTFAAQRPVDIWTTPTSGGIANAIEPAPWRESASHGGASSRTQYLSLTDSERGLVMILGFDGKAIREICRITLPWPDEQPSASGPDGDNVGAQGDDKKEKVVQAATAVWLQS